MTMMQTWCDSYPCRSERKGGHVEIETTKSVVTANQPPWKMYRKLAVIRRQAFAERFECFEITMSCDHPKSAKCACPRTKTRVPVPQIATREVLYTGTSSW